MAHNWGVQLPDPPPPTEMLIDLVDGLSSGRISLSVPDGVKITPEVTQWLRECEEQMLDLYRKELARRVN